MVNKPSFEQRGAWGELLPVPFETQVSTQAEQLAGLVIKFIKENFSIHGI